MRLRDQVDLVEFMASFEELLMKAENFRHLAKAPSSSAVQNAKLLLRILSKYDFLPEKVVPSALGGITFFYYDNGDAPAMFEIQNDGTIWAAYMGKEQSYLLDVNISDFDTNIVEELKKRLQ